MAAYPDERATKKPHGNGARWLVNSPQPSQRIPHPRVEGATVLVPEYILDQRLAKDCDQPWAESRIVNRLRLAAGGVVIVPELVDAVFGHRADGGPRSAHNNVNFYIHRLRRKGFPIERVANGRYRWAVK
jgi:hypothetical protein